MRNIIILMILTLIIVVCAVVGKINAVQCLMAICWLVAGTAVCDEIQNLDSRKGNFVSLLTIASGPLALIIVQVLNNSRRS
jgi:hypothetical protein